MEPANAGIKEKLAAAIEGSLHEGISKEESTRQLAERIVAQLGIFVQTIQPGPTGKFPEGQIDETDQGELRLLISHKDETVRIDFGKPTAWIAMPRSQALTFAFSVLEHCGVQIEHKIQQDPAPGEPA